MTCLTHELGRPALDVSQVVGVTPTVRVHGPLATPRRALNCSEQTFDMRRVLWLLRRQRSIVAACVLVGAIIPAVLLLWRPVSYTATSLVLVPNSTSNTASGGSNGASSDANVTDSTIAGSSAVLGAAGARVTPHLTLQTAEKRVNCVARWRRISYRSRRRAPPPVRPRLWPTQWPTSWLSFVTSCQVSNGSSAVAGLQAQASAADPAGEQVRQGDPSPTSRDRFTRARHPLQPNRTPSFWPR